MTAITYPTLGQFLDKVGALDLSESPDSPMWENIGALEAYLLNLLMRWQLEDEAEDNPESRELLDTVRKELAELNKEMTDDERGQAMRHLVEWTTRGDGWLRDYIDRLVATDDNNL